MPGQMSKGQAEKKTRKSRGRARKVAGRPEILAAARSIGIRKGWKAVTIRAVAQKLGYTSPLLYEHFRDKQEILTELAIESQLALAKELLRDLPTDPYGAVLAMVERYWSFMLENKPRRRNLWVLLVRVPREVKPCAAEHDAR